MTGQARGLEGLCLSGVPGDVVERTQRRFFDHIDAAAVLGSKVTLGLMRGLGSTHNADADLAQLREAMLPIADYAQKKGVTVLLEPINRYETILLNSGIEVYDFIVNDLGNPDSIGILWDLFHANIEDRDFAETVANNIEIPLEFADERLSSAEAKRSLREKGLSEKAMRGKVDMIAASIFLQSWLDARNGAREQVKDG